ncbi:putative Endonuclease/exonuclease/phosphatase [metagenome]|uniref:Putative Endonuclease/exonuclease/phosphatase n=1 Tax=metagenome TaxID=256318 RepID=A0A2P2CG14_9ZZZZ
MGRHAKPQRSARTKPTGSPRARRAFGSTAGWLGKTAALVVAVVATSVLAGSIPGSGLTASIQGASTERDPYPDARSASPSPTAPAAPARVVKGQVFVPKKSNVAAFRERMLLKGYVQAPPGSTLSTEFVVSSFNVLGAGHTAKGGDRKGFASGDSRIRNAVTLLRSHGVSVAGLQEFQSTQYHTFAAVAGEYGVWPAMTMGQAPVQNSIVWRRSEWEFVEGRTSQIPYFGGRRMPMPHILLRSLESGREVWFANYHNPADAHGPAQRWRDAAASIEAALARELTADGTPMIITGDMNDREEYACRLTGSAPMHSADGAHTEGGSCRLPRQMNVDWIFGSPSISFTGFVTDRSSLVNRTTDHPMVRSTATIAPLVESARCIKGPKRSGLVYCPKD